MQQSPGVRSFILHDRARRVLSTPHAWLWALLEDSLCPQDPLVPGWVSSACSWPLGFAGSGCLAHLIQSASGLSFHPQHRSGEAWGPLPWSRPKTHYSVHLLSFP